MMKVEWYWVWVRFPQVAISSVKPEAQQDTASFTTQRVVPCFFNGRHGDIAASNVTNNRETFE